MIWYICISLGLHQTWCICTKFDFCLSCLYLAYQVHTYSLLQCYLPYILLMYLLSSRYNDIQWCVQTWCICTKFDLHEHSSNKPDCLNFHQHQNPELDDKSSKEFIMSIYICYFSTYYYGKISLHKVKQ